jgi:hypothetical protein
MLATVAVAACHHGPARTLNTGSHPQRGTTVRVENRRPIDMDVEVAAGSERAHLGTVSAQSTAVFTIPPMFVNPSVPFRLLAAPAGGVAAPIGDAISVSPGDGISIIIAPY